MRCAPRASPRSRTPGPRRFVGVDLARDPPGVERDRDAAHRVMNAMPENGVRVGVEGPFGNVLKNPGSDALGHRGRRSSWEPRGRRQKARLRDLRSQAELRPSHLTLNTVPSVREIFCA